MASNDKIFGFLDASFEEYIINNIDIDISKEDLLSKLQADGINTRMLNAIDYITDDVIKTVEENRFAPLIEERRNTNAFLSRMDLVWRDSFSVFEVMYNIVLEATEPCFVENYDDKPDKKYQHVALREIQGRACQQYLEILCLMQNGFADGACARWRSLYELSVVACFISESGEEVAKSYFESNESSDTYYNWARPADCFKSFKQSRHINFNEILKNTKSLAVKENKQYDLSHMIIHATPQGTFCRLGNATSSSQIPCGRSNYGFPSVAIHSAHSLAVITDIFLLLSPTYARIAYSKCIWKWVDVIKRYFKDTEKEYFSEYMDEIKDDKDQS